MLPLSRPGPSERDCAVATHGSQRGTRTTGYTLVSLSTPGPVGGGPFIGLYPDPVTIAFLLTPALPGNLLHFVVNGVNYPDNGGTSFGPGALSGLAGLSMDAVEVLLDIGQNLVFISNVSRAGPF